MQVYTNKMFNVYVDHVKSGRISFEDVDTVISLPLRKDDPLLLQLGARLGRIMRYGDPNEIPPSLNGYVKNHPWLKRWVGEELDTQDTLPQVEVQTC